MTMRFEARSLGRVMDQASRRCMTSVARSNVYMTPFPGILALGYVSIMTAHKGALLLPWLLN